MAFRMGLGLLFLLTIGCSGGVEEQGIDGGETIPNPVPIPAPVVKKSKWGDLDCQKRTNCKNPILNLDKDLLVDLLNDSWEWSLFNEPRSIDRFFCGIDFIDQWNEKFISDFWKQPHINQKVIEFGTQVLDIENCGLSGTAEEALNQFFKNTEEYKNENQ